MKKIIGLTYSPFHIIAALLILVIVSGCRTTQADDPLTPQEREWLTAHDGKITMALETNYAPFAFVDENGTGRGLATEHIELIEKKLNFRIKKNRFNALNEILDSARKKEIDIVNAATETKDRSNYLLFTKPFIKIPNVIIVRRDRKDSLTIDKMKNMKIALVKNYAVTEHLTQNFNESNIVLVPDDLTALISVSFNQADATVIDLATASYFIEQKGITNLRIAGESGYDIKLAIASRNDWPVLNRIMEKGLSLITEKEKKSIKDKWVSFGQIRLSESKDFWIISVTAFFTFLLVIVGIMVWNRLLTRQVEQRTTQLKNELAVRNQSEKELKELKLQLSNALDMARLGHWEYDVADDLFIFNDHFYKIFDTTAEQAGGYTMSSSEYASRFVHPDDIHMVAEETRKAIETDSPDFNRQLEHRTLHPDGDIGYISVRYFIVKDAHGRTVKTYGVNQDITGRKKVEESLRISEEKYRTLFENMVQGIFYQRADGVLFDYNDAALEMFGLTPDQFIGKTSLDPQWNVIKEDGTSLPGEKHPSMTALQTGKPVRNEIVGVYNPQGKNYRWIVVNAIPQFNTGEKKPFQVFVTLQDITERKKMEEQLRQAQKMESIGRLAGGVAHDSNNMLSIILGNTEMILEDVDPANPVVANLHEIRKAAERSTNLTRQLLAFARKQTISPIALDLNQTIEGMLNMLRRLIGENIDLVWLPAISLWTIKFDPSQLDQILANLCVNARDSIKDVGKITIETCNISFDEGPIHTQDGFKSGEYVMMALSDNGCGMDKGILDNIFEPFFTTKGVGEGTGLGLATVYGIIKQNSGFINVYSEPGRGTTFRIYFPRHSENDPPTQKPISGETYATGNETILLVEDEEAILRMTKMMLERLGYTVLSAPNPDEALRIGTSASQPIDLLMTDVVMPMMNGRDLAKAMTKLFPGLTCLFMSGYTANVIAHHGILDDGMQFIQKPFSRQDLADKIREVLDEAKRRLG